MVNDTNRRVLVVGLDGATWDILRPLAKKGRLPHLRAMMEQGARGVLQSTVPPVTPAAWTTVFTGKNPGRHGIYDFQRIDRQSYEFSTVRTHRHLEKTLWQLLGEREKHSILVDVPFTYPPQPLNGLMITGYGTPRTADTVFTYPHDLAQRLPPELRSEIRVALPENRFDRSQRFIDEWRHIMDGRRRLLRHLVQEEPWDFFMVVFSVSDNMAHVFWTYADPAHPNYYRAEARQFREAFFQSYEQCDRLLGELTEAAGSGSATLVISDHGFGSVRPRQYIFQRLLEGGYLAARRSAGGAGVASEKFLKFALKTYSRFPVIRELVKGMRPGSRERLKETLQKAGALPDVSAVDYRRSQVIVSSFGLQLWINERARFPNGPVAPKDRQQLLDELSAFLLEDRDVVTGLPVIRAVHLGQDVYEGPYHDDCPDLVIEYNNLFGQGGRAKTNSATEGGHTHDGIFLAQGAGIRAGRVDGARLVDLAPTVLHLLGIPSPPDMDGAVVEQMLTMAYRRQHPVQRGNEPARWEDLSAASGGTQEQDYTEAQDAELREQLRQLGYL